MSLKWAYVDLDSPALHLPDSKTGAKVVHVGHPVIELLRSAQRIDGNPWVITGTLPGKPLSDLQPFWQRVRARAGVKDVRIHDLRHTFASAAVASGQGLPMIGKLLGHTQVQTTARYAHLAAEPVRCAADSVATSLRAALGKLFRFSSSTIRQHFAELNLRRYQKIGARRAGFRRANATFAR
jgi:integrase